MEWFGLEGTLKIIWFQPPCRERDIFHQPRVPRAPSSLALNTAREGAATAALGSLGQGLTTLMGKNFFLISNLNLPPFSLQPFPLVLSLPTLVKSPSPSFLSAPSGTGRCSKVALVFVCFMSYIYINYFFLGDIFAGLVSRSGWSGCWPSTRASVCESVPVYQGASTGGARPSPSAAVSG